MRSIPKTVYVFFLLILVSACTYTQKIKDGDTAFERRHYPLAIQLLNKEIDSAKTRAEKAEKAFKIAESLRLMGRYNDSLEWYQFAYDNGYGSEALRGYAYMLKTTERYADAQTTFKDLGIEIGSLYEFRKEIAICKQAETWKADLPYSPYKIYPAPFNSPSLDFAPVPYGDKILFSSDRSDASGEESYHWTGSDFMDLFIADEDGMIEPFEVINTDKNEATATLSGDGNLMIFARCDYQYEDKDYCRLYEMERINGEWADVRELPFQEDGINYIQPALSADGKTLYFVSDAKDGWGGYDIYQSKFEKGEWNPASLLSRSINSEGDEMFPAIHQDTLYFASNYWPGMGGLDIFRSVYYQDRGWTPAYLIPPPINSGADDFAFVVTGHSDLSGLPEGMFTSSREGGNGRDDIYYFEEVVPKERPVEEVPDTIEEIQKKLILNVYVVEEIFQIPDDPNSRVLGKKPIPSAELMIVQEGDMASRATCGNEGLHSFEAALDSDYQFTASKEGYLTNQKNFSTHGINLTDAQPVVEYDVEIVLDKIIVNKEITLENIYYDFDKWDIRSDAEPTLNELAGTLEDNPGIRIQLSSHTDCRGNNDYNADLSQKRAQSAVDYLISRGIDPVRLVAQGYGESVPIVNCPCRSCTEDEHQANRRTTFKILE